MQCSRDRRRAESQHVDFQSQMFECLLDIDAEPLLLVNNDQPEILEPDVLRNQTMSPHDNVDLAGLQFLDDLLLLPLCFEPRQRPDRDGKFGHAFTKRSIVLFGEDRCRNQNRNLPTGVDHLERRPHRDFRFSVTNVATDQPVHRSFAFKVLLALDDRRRLIRSRRVRECGFELLLPVRIRRAGKARFGRSRRLKANHVGSQIDDRFRNFFFLLCPRRAADQ